MTAVSHFLIVFVAEVTTSCDKVGCASHVMLSASRQIATQRLGGFLASEEATVSSISLQRQRRSHMFRSDTTGTLT